MNAKDVVTSTLDSINVMTAGALKKKEGATIQFEPLLQSSTDSSCCRSCGVAFLPDSQSLLEGFQAERRALRGGGARARQAQVGVSERRSGR